MSELIGQTISHEHEFGIIYATLYKFGFATIDLLLCGVIQWLFLNGSSLINLHYVVNDKLSTQKCKVKININCPFSALHGLPRPIRRRKSLIGLHRLDNVR